MARGPFIVVEGLDRAGKTTQIELLRARIEKAGKRVKIYKFPDRTTPIGKMIDAYLQNKDALDDRAIHLLFSANRWEHAPNILADLAAGSAVIADRYAFSGVAYTFAKQSSSSPSITIPVTEKAKFSTLCPCPLTLDWCMAPDTGLPCPDLVLFLSLSPAQAAARGGYGGERYEKAEMQERVREIFRTLEQRHLQDTLKSEGENGAWVEIDAGRPVEAVAQEMWGAITGHALIIGTIEEPVVGLWTQ